MDRWRALAITVINLRVLKNMVHFSTLPWSLFIVLLLLLEVAVQFNHLVQQMFSQ
jgi:hypothetical protein